MSLRRVLAASLVVFAACADEAVKGGSAVGLHARVRAGGVELVSEEAEVRLDPPGDAELTARSASVVRPQLDGPHRRAGGVAPVRASWAARTPPATAACGVGKPAEKIGTINGSLCWVSASLTSGSLVEENAIYEFLLLGRDGIYKATQVSTNVYYPPDFGHFGVTAAVGCAKSPDGDFITTEYLSSMSAFAVAYSIGPYIVGFTAFIVPGRAFVPAIEYDSGYGLTASLIPWPIGISLNLMEKSNYTTPPTLIVPWNKSCGAPAPLPGPGFRAGEDDTLATIAAGLHGLQSAPGDDNIAVLQREMAASLLPVFDMLSAPSGGAPTDDAPAATQADLFRDWLARGDGEQLCADCPATSIDHLLYEFDRQVQAAGDDSDAILLAGIEGADRQVQFSPQLLEQANLQRQLSPGVALAGVIADEVIAGGDAGRFVDARIVVVPAQLGVAADLSIGADEIADLIGVDAAALAGATVTLDASPVVEAASFTLTDGEVQASYTPQDPAPVLFRYAVDLSTAAGPLPAGAADWVVRPAMRRMQPASGPPARVLLTAPYRAIVDTPVVLSAMVLDADYSPITGPLAVDFLDGEGELLASAEGQYGSAMAAVVPSPSIPAIAAVMPTTLKYGDDSTGPGFAVTGTGFSREAVVRVDGVSLAERGLLVAVISSREILFEDDGGFAGDHKIVVENPHDTPSNTSSFTGP
ncbi:hypothetical protein [Nannocystis sp.]|uniref:hypothetical protein n=1 Tax=Nannocystis sp. TaxID=1962667 RepID=UPI0025E49A9F|nr:hypothetical protein [Nannocystis sp.]MBK7825523.1 hypothetical protein [Nannocystis sp.]